jgi:hypothetical protein
VARLVPCPTRRELELAVPIAHEDPHEVVAKGDPLGVRPGVEIKPVGAVVQDAVAGRVGADRSELIDPRGRLAAHELDTVLEHQIDGSIVHRHQERIAIPAVVNHADFHGRAPRSSDVPSLSRRILATKRGGSIRALITRQSRLPVQSMNRLVCVFAHRHAASQLCSWSNRAPATILSVTIPTDSRCRRAYEGTKPRPKTGGESSSWVDCDVRSRGAHRHRSNRVCQDCGPAPIMGQVS